MNDNANAILTKTILKFDLLSPLNFYYFNTFTLFVGPLLIQDP